MGMLDRLRGVVGPLAEGEWMLDVGVYATAGEHIYIPNRNGA